MNGEELATLMSNEADLLPRMSGIYDVLFRLLEDADETLTYEIVTLIQAAFWSGMEAGILPEYKKFREKIREIQHAA